MLSFPYLRDVDTEVPDSDEEHSAPQLSKSPHAPKISKVHWCRNVQTDLLAWAQGT